MRLEVPGGPRFGIGAAVFGDLEPEDVQLVGALGFPGLEPYRQWLTRYLDRPAELRRLLDQAGVAMVTCSNGGPGQSTDFIEPELRSTTIADHLDFAQRFLSEFGCRHFKINLGRRPAAGTTDAQLQAIAGALNDLGREVSRLGIRLAPHPHIWGPVERPEEIDRLLELTDPAYVWLTLDTAHVLLGGGDPLEVLERHWDRIAALHWKDAAPAYRGWTGPTPTRDEHERECLYKDLGAGGVDLERVWRVVEERGYRYWITLDLDPPRAGEGSVKEKLERNAGFLRERLSVSHF
ncbi:MAG: TIM barrel protein [Candidatus Dormibacteraeota bacterium]|nr:TIM barrel protein [Candidatus Dormibacteraeota bacterium]